MTTLLDAPPHFLTVAQVHALRAITQRGLNLALWPRAAQPRVLGLLDALVETRAHLAIAAAITSSADGARAVESAPALALRHRDPALQDWISDLQLLTTTFSIITRAPALRLRLETVRDDACAVFHADTLALRLLCTYRGEGTQWLEESNLRRDELGLRGRTVPEANAAICRDADQIRTIPAWTVAVLKGRAYPGEDSSALVHRSFSVCCRDHTRVRLCLDPID